MNFTYKVNLTSATGYYNHTQFYSNSTWSHESLRNWVKQNNQFKDAVDIVLTIKKYESIDQHKAIETKKLNIPPHYWHQDSHINDHFQGHDKNGLATFTMSYNIK